MHCSVIGLIMDNLFYTYRHDHDVVFLQQWTGKFLESLNFVECHADLKNCHKKIILLNVVDANCHIDLLRQLIKQKNYIIFFQLGEVHSHDLAAIFVDCPEAKEFSFILGGEHKNLDCVAIDFYYFSTLTDPNIMRAQLDTTDQIYQTLNKPYKYLYLNGADRLHRNLLWKSLENTNQLEYALKSYLGYAYESDHVCDIPLTGLPKEYESPYLDTDKMSTYSNNTRNYNAFKVDCYTADHHVDSHIVPLQYISTYFSVVAETIVNPQFTFVTEKTFKPLLAGHPFIVLSSPGFYKKLHRLGFKTFNGIIDESFDDENDLNKRIELINIEIEKLCSSDLPDFLKKTKNICLYNQQHYINNRHKIFQSNHYELNNFFKRIVDKFVSS